MVHPAFRQLFVVVALAASVACGYSLSGRGSFLPPHIKVIGVPTFTNLSGAYDVDRRVTDRVRSELISRGRYKVEPSNTGVDAVIVGEISSITITPSAVNEQRLATRALLLLTAKVEFRDVSSNKVLWSNPSLQFREEYEISGTVGDPNAFFGQHVDALDRMAEAFAKTLVSALLEAF